ncbi:hypothetical protein FRC12_024416 [Ceratobasidium sp. 428]|nr:hypothetical protein FRC12_024416 [Ceratobasidium sp. 428]
MSLVSPWMEGGTVKQYIENNPAKDRYKLCLGVAKAVAFMHIQNMVHGDIKSSNVMIDREGVVKLNDFGNVRSEWYRILFTPTNMGRSKPPLRWSAPELFAVSNGLPNLETDVYGLGMTLLEIITGDIPFGSDSTDWSLMLKMSEGNLKPERPTTFPTFEQCEEDPLWKILVATWDYEAGKRPSATRVRDDLAAMRQQNTQIVSPGLASGSFP